MQISRILKIIAGLIVIDVLAVYAFCLAVKGVYPPSHPWSGIALLLLSGSLFLQARSSEKTKPNLIFGSIVGAVLSIAGCSFWTIAAILK